MAVIVESMMGSCSEHKSVIGELSQCSDHSYEVENWGCRVRFLAETRDFSLLQNAQTGPGAYPASWLSGSVSSLVKRLRLDANHLPSSSAAVKKEWSYKSAPPYALMAWTGITVFSLTNPSLT
jgi:hypothetical protein